MSVSVISVKGRARRGGTIHLVQNVVRSEPMGMPALNGPACRGLANQKTFRKVAAQHRLG